MPRLTPRAIPPAAIAALCVVAAAVGLVQSPIPAGAAAVSVSVSSGSAAAGSDYAATVSAAGGARVGAMEFRLTWDPGVLEFKSIDKDKLLASNVLLESKLKSPGELSVAWVAQEPVAADGALLTPKFSVKGGPDAKTALTLQSLKAWGPGPSHHGPAAHHLVDVQAMAKAGEFTVAGSGGGKSLLYGSLAAAAVVILAAVVWRLRKPRASR